MKKSAKPKVVDLFSGCGGMSLGFEKAGFKIVLAVDSWRVAVSTYRENFNHPVMEADVSDPTFLQHVIDAKPDVIIGGPPCQDFSSAGKRDESLGRADLTVQFAKIVTAVRPRFFVMENVQRAKGSRAFASAKELLEKAGYFLSENIIDASKVGVPQSRKRLIVVGGLDEPVTALSVLVQSLANAKTTTVRDYFKGTLGTEFYYRHPRSYKRKAVYSIDEPSPTIRGVNRPIPEGYSFHATDATRDLSLVRPLTTRERALIQTFPGDFLFNGSKTEVEQQIGNAVPVLLAKFVAKCLMTHIRDTPPLITSTQSPL